MRIAPSTHRLGEDLVSCYLVEEAGQVTIIDAGVPAYYGDLIDELTAMGRTIEDVRAVVLTHGHSDHIGFAERVMYTNTIVGGTTLMSIRSTMDREATEDEMPTSDPAWRLKVIPRVDGTGLDVMQLIDLTNTTTRSGIMESI